MMVSSMDYDYGCFDWIRVGTVEPAGPKSLPPVARTWCNLGLLAGPGKVGRGEMSAPT
jgi:hypothetical protein